jgi:hypothetical protein
MLNLELYLALNDVKDLEVVVTIHPDAATRTQEEKTNVDREERIEGPSVDSVIVDLRLDNLVSPLPTC